MNDHTPKSYGGPDFAVVCATDGQPWPCDQATPADPSTDNGADPTPPAEDASGQPADPVPAQDAPGAADGTPVPDQPPADPATPDGAISAEQGA